MSKVLWIVRQQRKFLVRGGSIQRMNNFLPRHVVTENIAKGNRVELRGFGTFGLKELKARKSRNPRTGATVFVENKRIPYFRMGKKLKERIN